MKSLNIDPNNALSTEPTGLLIDRVEIVTYQGKINDIKPVVATITIIESLYSPTLLLELGIKDQSNLIEDLPIIGQEKLIGNYKLSSDSVGSSIAFFMSLNFLSNSSEFSIPLAINSCVKLSLMQLKVLTTNSRVSNLAL